MNQLRQKVFLFFFLFYSAVSTTNLSARLLATPVPTTTMSNEQLSLLSLLAFFGILFLTAAENQLQGGLPQRETSDPLENNLLSNLENPASRYPDGHNHGKHITGIITSPASTAFWAHGERGSSRSLSEAPPFRREETVGLSHLSAGFVDSSSERHILGMTGIGLSPFFVVRNPGSGAVAARQIPCASHFGEHLVHLISKVSSPETEQLEFYFVSMPNYEDGESVQTLVQLLREQYPDALVKKFYSKSFAIDAKSGKVYTGFGCGALEHDSSILSDYIISP